MTLTKLHHDEDMKKCKRSKLEIMPITLKFKYNHLKNDHNPYYSFEWTYHHCVA